MSGLDHWQAIALSKDVKSRPLARVVNATEVVLFRSTAGAVAALNDLCPHRGMRLSKGHVDKGRLVCPYHGWSYDAQGLGSSPGTPRVKVCAIPYEVREVHGVVWIKRKGSEAVFPSIEREGYECYGVLHRSVAAPLELVLDNFTEVEHTPSTHALFGYSAASLSEIETTVELTDSSVRVINKGPQKKVPWFVSLGFGIRTGDPFIDDWTTYFSPIHSVYDQWWQAGQSGRARPRRFHIVVFFTPTKSGWTDLIVFIFFAKNCIPFFVPKFLFKALVSRLVDHEVSLDITMLEQLADMNPGLEQRRLGRFDRALRENRKRIQLIYEKSSEPSNEESSED